MKFLCIPILLIMSSGMSSVEEWGFFAHKEINRYAVFTLPPEMLGFYKRNIDFISEHAVDPDKRRFALRNEATRHYIDIDQWDTVPFTEIPRDFRSALLKYGQWACVTENEDTIRLEGFVPDSLLQAYVYSDRYSEIIVLGQEFPDLIRHADELREENITDMIFINELAACGVLPFFLNEFYYRLIMAFESRNEQAILKISSDIGHYISDAHVPLHTTVNYNGQLTGQEGIHAFWESRLPELFAKDEYDYMVGKAKYIENIEAEIWNIIISSHKLVADLLQTESKVREQFPADKQHCFDDRNGRILLLECPEFARAYHEALAGTVEQRFRASIMAVGSFWYSAWVEAGQPDMDNLNEE